jgi:hypothetical protein
VHLHFVDGAITHLWQKAGLVLRTAGESLSCDVAVFESSTRVTSEYKNQIPGSSSNDLVGVVDGQDVSIVCYIQEPILILVIKLLFDVGRLDLCNLVAYSSRVSLRVLSINSKHDFDFNFDRLVKEAAWLNKHVVLQQVSQLLDASFNLDIPLSDCIIFKNEFFDALAL